MSVLSSIGRLASRYSARRSRYLTERAIRSLPLELRKDIGWPELSDCSRRQPYGAGLGAGTETRSK